MRPVSSRPHLLLGLFFSAIAVASSGCSSIPKEELVVTLVKDPSTPLSGASTEPASVAKAFSGSRSPASDQYCDVLWKESDTLESTLKNWIAEGLITKGEADQFSSLDASARQIALARSLGQLFTYGEALRSEFDELIESGLTVRDFTTAGRKGRALHPAYVRLLALREIRDRLLLGAQADIGMAMKSDFFPGGAAAGRSVRSKFSAPKKSEKEVYVSLLRGVIQGYESSLQSFVGNQESGSGIIDLALDEIRGYTSDLIEYVDTCDAQVFGTAAERSSRAMAVEIKNRRGLRAVVTDYQKFQPQKGEAGIDVVRIAQAMGSKIFKSLLRSTERETAADGPIFGPSTQKKGNIVGGNFPNGVWALTYDDGPAKTTPQVLANLGKHDSPTNPMKATFFILSQQITPTMYPSVAKEEAAKGHAVASHSYTHAQVNKLGPVGKDKEINKAADVFAQVFGKRPEYYRLPYGAGVNDPVTRKMIADAKMIHVFWNVDTLDWQDKNPESIFKRAVTQMTNLKRGIILFHDIHPQSVVASELLMAYMKDPANRICTVTIPEVANYMNDSASGKSVPALCSARPAAH